MPDLRGCCSPLSIPTSQIHAMKWGDGYRNTASSLQMSICITKSPMSEIQPKLLICHLCKKVSQDTAFIRGQKHIRNVTPCPTSTPFSLSASPFIFSLLFPFPHYQSLMSFFMSLSIPCHSYQTAGLGP